MGDERGRKRGRSFIGTLDTQAKTARPTSVGPHHVTRDQEDPGNPGITPEKDYAAEIARNNDAAAQRPGPGVVTPAPTAETAEQGGLTQDAAEKAGGRDAPPLRGSAGSDRSRGERDRSAS
jgi:hypothetical protein